MSEYMSRGYRREFIRELISLRFSQGFQVVIGPAVAKAFGQKQIKIGDIFSRDQPLEDGTSVFMSVGNTIHQLSCVNGTEVEVNNPNRADATRIIADLTAVDVRIASPHLYA